MSGESAYTARGTARTQTRDLINELTLHRNESGQYQHDDIEVFITGVERQLKSLYNPLDPGKGMTKLLAKTPNSLNSIKSTDMADPASILKQAKADAAKLSTQTGMTEKPEFETRADAQDEADRRNYAYQAAIGAKEGATEAITNKVGSEITDSVLRTTTGNDYKSVDEYNLSDIIDAVRQGAIRPVIKDILTQVVQTYNYQFNFRKTIAQNMEQLRAKTNRLNSYGITHDESAITLTLLANVDYASNNDWGREFRTTMQDIRKKYKYNHTHDATSLAWILSELATADASRNLSDAPEPNTESANAVDESVSLLRQMMQQAHDSDVGDYEEEAYAAQSDSESSNEKRSSRRSNSKSSRGRSKSREKSRTPSTINKDCPHCKTFKRRKRHPNVPNEKCFWNKKYKGYRAKWICEELEIPYVPRHKFSADMGGYRDEDSE
jgi:hypothetical protein